MRALSLALAATLTAATAAAQARPSTDIYLAHIERHGSQPASFRLSTNATHRIGYDNQPSFTPDGRAFLYTAVGADAQTDIWRYDLGRNAASRITDTRESEYSPTVTPDGGHFSVIRVEADSTQRLWRFSLGGRGDPELVLTGVKPVGYHAWAGDYTLALFVLGAPNTLQLADTRTGAADTVARNIGRSLKRIPGSALISFVLKLDEKEWWVETLDPATRKLTPLVRTLEGREDVAWLDESTALMASGSRLYAWSRPAGGGWVEVADFGPGIANITRLAISPRGDWLAFVADDAPAGK